MATVRFVCERHPQLDLITVNVMLNGQSYIFLIDTGSNYSTLSSSIVQSLGLRPSTPRVSLYPVIGGVMLKQPPKHWIIDYVRFPSYIGEYTLENLEFIESDHAVHLGEEEGLDIEVDGVLGTSFFDRYRAVTVDVALPGLELRE